MAYRDFVHFGYVGQGHQHQYSAHGIVLLPSLTYNPYGTSHGPFTANTLRSVRLTHAEKGHRCCGALSVNRPSARKIYL